ncbi:MAG: hypothetical protein Q9194_003919, partial [Teloschistes cf. exilis]
MAHPGQSTNLTHLSPEILRGILDHLPWKRHLRSLLLTCKQLYELVLPELYRQIVWKIAAAITKDKITTIDKKSLKLADPQNRGLKYIRQLILFDCIENRRPIQRVYKSYELAMLVKALSKNTLTSFHWDSWHLLPAYIYQDLLSNQRTLTELELKCSPTSIDEMVKHGPSSLLDGLQDVEQLRIMPGPNEAMPKAASDFFRNHREVRSLRLDLWHMSTAPVSGSDDEEDLYEHESFTSSYVLHTLFHGFAPPTVSLHNLDLGGVDLKGEHNDLATALNLPILSKLCFRKCWHPEDFLTALVEAAGQSQLKLQHLSSYHWEPLSNLFKDPYSSEDDSSSEDEPESSTKDANLLVEILGSLLDKTCNESLRELCVYLRGFNKNIEVEKIAQHGKMLKWLLLDLAVGSPVCYSLPDWQWLCSSLEVIEQFDAAYRDVFADCNIAGNLEFLSYI